MGVFGDTTAGGNSAPGSADRSWMSKFTANGSGTVTQINVRFHSTSAAGDSFKGLIYAADGPGGIPGTLLGVGAATSIPAGGGDLASTGLSVSITNGVDYWLGGVTNGFSGVFEDDLSGAVYSRSENSATPNPMSYASPPATYSESAGGTASFNVYATYTEGVTNSVFYLRA